MQVIAAWGEITVYNRALLSCLLCGVVVVVVVVVLGGGGEGQVRGGQEHQTK